MNNTKKQTKQRKVMLLEKLLRKNIASKDTITKKGHIKGEMLQRKCSREHEIKEREGNVERKKKRLPGRKW